MPAETENAVEETIHHDVETGASRLEEEGDIAADYLEELLDIADIDGDIDIEVRNGRTYISIVSDEEIEALKSLVGHDGEVLDALQELTRLSVLSATGNRSRLVLDISGYRERRNAELAQIAKDAAEAIKGGTTSVALAPMGAYERKIVHDAIAELGLESESEGEGSGRHIVVTAAQ
ncbi:protein jag [Arthrobacter sp. A2-55]|uniref:Jag family protein n=1 Tax=Arthrobacter sp. A2-55 TaxID=2897337 RepID=UPI0021CD7990|nr:R3H domain-containing nucleic acid-binding protein [Arthrobacter sp. A2-55]MCU6480779.1 RNA-binding protein [Arthrobacter sp. A2-55]